jgi:hypothetical protein
VFEPFVRNVASGRSMQAMPVGLDPMQPSPLNRTDLLMPMAFHLDWGTLDNSDTGVDFWLYTPYYTRVERATLAGYPKFSAPDVRVQFVHHSEDEVIELSPEDQLEELSSQPFDLTPPGSMQALPLFLRVRGPQVSGKTALLTLHVINSENR